MAHEMTVVITYDVARPGTRRRVAKLLQQRLTRVQKSVFEGRMTRVAADRLYEDAEQAIDEDDRLRMYIITANGLDHCRATGNTPVADDAAYWLL